MARHARITGTGRYIPAKLITNEDLDLMLGQPVSQWLIENTGIRERHVMAEDETTSDLLLHASRQALDRAAITASDLDLIIVATDTPDYISPATSSVLHHKLGAGLRTGTFDVNCACAAWVTGLDMAAKQIATDPDMQHILVAGGYGMTRYLDWTDKYTCTLFADGAGAVVVSVADQPGWLAGKMAAAGEYHDALGIYSGGTFRPATPEVVAEQGKPRVQFVRKFPATFNSDNWPPLIEAALKKAGGYRFDDVNYYLFTQLNLRTIEYVMQAMEQPMSKTHWIMDKWGYLGSACIPAALDDGLEQGHGPHPGDLVVFCATGGGMSLAVSVWRW